MYWKREWYPWWRHDLEMGNPSQRDRDSCAEPFYVVSHSKLRFWANSRVAAVMWDTMAVLRRRFDVVSIWHRQILAGLLVPSHCPKWILLLVVVHTFQPHLTKCNKYIPTETSSTMSMTTSPNGNIFRITGSLWGNPPVTGGFSSQRPVMRSFDVFFYLRLNKWLSKQSRHQWFKTPSRSLWRHCNGHLKHT